MKKNNSWTSIILAMWLVMLIVLTSQFILSYIIPFAKWIKWVENASIAYYQANSWIEEAMWTRSQNNYWYETTLAMDSSEAQDYSYNIEAKWSNIPPIWNWNSDFNINRNKIWINEPIQLVLYDEFKKKISNIDFNKTWFYFYVPHTNSDDSNMSFSWNLNIDIINWQLSWSWNTVNAIDRIDGTLINWSKEASPTKVILWNKDWKDLYNPDTPQDLQYRWGLIWVDDLPVLKLSVVNKLEWWWIWYWWNLPFLEYEANFQDINSQPVEIPIRYTRIKTSWKSYWFTKNLEFRMPQVTTNQAFDFTVFQ